MLLQTPTVAGGVLERALVVEAIERAMHAFGVGRLDLAFEALRGLLKEATVAKGS